MAARLRPRNGLSEIILFKNYLNNQIYEFVRKRAWWPHPMPGETRNCEPPFTNTTHKSTIYASCDPWYISFRQRLIASGEGKGQDLDKVMVTVQFKNSTLKNALRKIERQTRLPFAYRTDDVAPYSDINFSATDISLSKLLRELLGSTDLGFEQVSSNIVIRKRGAAPVPKEEPDPVATPVFEGGIRGKVTNEKGEVLLAQRSFKKRRDP